MMFFLQSYNKLCTLKNKDTKGIAYNNWMYLEINTPDIRLILLNLVTYYWYQSTPPLEMSSFTIFIHSSPVAVVVTKGTR